MPERVSKYDAMFLNCDNDVAEMQVAAASLVDGPIDFERYKAYVAPRIARLPRLCQALRPVPFDFRYPAWVEVPNFDPADHFEQIDLPAPGNDQQLRDLLTERIHHRLDRTKPLWRLLIVNGLEGGRSAMVFNVHHAICDASSAMEIFKALYDDPEGGWPDHVHLQRAEAPVKRRPPVPIRVIKGLSSRETRTRLGYLWRYAKAPGPWFPFTQPVSGRMQFSWRNFPLDRLQAIRKSLGGTMTDVGLAAVGGALDRYAAREGIDVKDQFFKVILPENVRAANSYGEMGNAVSGIPTLVPLGIADPAERLARVTAYTRMAKEQRLGRQFYEILTGLMDLFRPMGATKLSRLLASPKWIRFAQRFVKTPREHAIITSVQTHPSVVFKIDGHEVTRSLPMVPCGLSLGMMCGLISYKDQLQISLTGDAKNLSDIDALMDDLAIVIDEMYAAANLIPATPPQPLESVVAK
jgi:WS/DGAT/MGAT family acyltransferase